MRLIGKDWLLTLDTSERDDVEEALEYAIKILKRVERKGADEDAAIANSTLKKMLKAISMSEGCSEDD